MKVHQLSVIYEQAQDRILARINTTAGEELRVWLTRRLCLKLWPTLNKAVAEHVVRQKVRTGQAQAPMGHADDRTRQMMVEFDRHESLQKVDFKTPYKAQPSLLPLGAEPLVVTLVTMSPLENGSLQLDFQEKLSDRNTQRGFQMAMEPQTMHSFIHLLDKALTRSGWLDDVTAPPASATPAVAVEKPKYLN